MRCRPSFAWTGPLLACTLALLGGCAAVPSALKPEPAPRVLALEVAAPPGLAELLSRYLDLARVDRLAEGTTVDDAEIDRLVAQAPEQARGLLATEGYFLAEVRAERLGGSPPRVRVTVEPGPRAVVRDVSLEVTGPLAEDARRADPHALAAQRDLVQAWPLPAGQPFRDAEWGEAKTMSIGRLRGQGWRAARWESTQALVDATRRQVDLGGTAWSGDLHRTGPLRIEGLEHHDASTVENIADFPVGSVATEELLLDFQERLQKSGLFDRSSVTLPPVVDDPAAAPVIVRLHERELQDLTLGLGTSANVGLRGSVEHTHRRLFGRAWMSRNRIELAQRQQLWAGEVSTHALPGLWRNLVAAGLERTEDDDVVLASRLRLGRAQDTERISRLIFAELEHSTTRSALRKERADSVAMHYQGIWRDLDDLLLPTRGRVWTGQAGVGLARSEPGGSGPFARLVARLDAFRPLPAGWFGQARVELGEVFARGDVRVPEPLRFRAGGDDSVRGYAYRSLTPEERGVPLSGEVLFTSSLEAARPVLERIPQLWGAVFVDAGRAARRWRDLDPAVGVGVGLRYRSPVGPVKLDLAWGEETRKLRLHLTVGVTF